MTIEIDAFSSRISPIQLSNSPDKAPLSSRAISRGSFPGFPVDGSLKTEGAERRSAHLCSVAASDEEAAPALRSTGLAFRRSTAVF
jgi:hypothetical protein